MKLGEIIKNKTPDTPFFDFIQKDIQAIGTISYWQHTLKKHPAPKCDNDVLLNLQYDYRTTGNSHILDAIYKACLPIANRFVMQFAKKNKKLFGKVDFCDIAQDATTDIIASYIRSPSWYIKKSFTGYLWLRVKHHIFDLLKVLSKESTQIDDTQDFVL